jgi:hypothetical protein
MYYLSFMDGAPLVVANSMEELNRSRWRSTAIGMIFSLKGAEVVRHPALA